MKAHICTPLVLALLALASCEHYDVPTGNARVSRLHSPAPAPRPEVKPVITQQQPEATRPVPPTPAPVAAPLPPAPEPVVAAPAPKPEVKKPEPRPIVSQQQPQPRRTATPSGYSAPSRASGLPLAPKRNYPLMPGQNRGLKARVR